MKLTQQQEWQRFQRGYTSWPALGMALDLSRADVPQAYFARMEAAMQEAFRDMANLEAGATANPDEGRQVGHYWLRQPALAPKPAIRADIEAAIAAVETFAQKVHRGETTGARGPFENLLVIGIGGSALGPQCVSHALGHPLTDKLEVHFIDNTDPDGMDKVLARIINQLGQTLCVVISKTGKTAETTNGMREVREAYERAGLAFSAHAVAVTVPGSLLHQLAKNWLERFPIWEWVGGRTSETSAVGLLPAALQGFDIRAMLAGARACDEVTRQPNTACNPAAQLALLWHGLTNGRGEKTMVVLPYKDRLEWFPRYLQQLVMESLGKELDRRQTIVRQGLTVYGNKGASDQHAYVQQLRDGVANFFVLFIQVLRDRQGEELYLEPDVTSGDYLHGFLLGTRAALSDNHRPSIALTLRDVSPFSVGALIALFERTVGLYASLININAYHQPGVQAGKDAAETVLALQGRVLAILRGQDRALTAEQIAQATGGAGDSPETVFWICEHLAANPGRGVAKISGSTPADSLYAAAATAPGRRAAPLQEAASERPLR
jgi:glucose-6-phosphate isomerase